MIIIIKHFYKIKWKRKKKYQTNKRKEERRKEVHEDESQKGTNTFLQVKTVYIEGDLVRYDIDKQTIT